MPTIRLIPSTYSRSNTNYVTVTSASNMYANTDSTTVGNFRGRASSGWSTSTYYAFLSGFNFNDIPSGAIVNSFTVKIKCYRNSYQATGSSYRIRLASSASSSSAISNTTLSEDITTTTRGTTYTIPTGNLTWSTLSGYGSNFSIEIPLRNSSTSSSNYPYVYVYGAEIEVTYTIPVYYTITATSNASGVTASPTTQSVIEGTSATVEFDCNDISNYTVTDNGNDVTSSCVRHTLSSTGSVSAVPGSNVTTGHYRSGGAFYQNSSTQSDAWLRYAIGHSAESPYSTSNTSNTY